MMSAFLTDLDVRRIDDDRWVLTAPLVYRSVVAAQTITVPAGFGTDFASVPRVPLAYWLCGGIGERAAVVHDYLYRSGSLPREICDAVYREAMLIDGVARWRVYLMWAMVRGFGEMFYRGKLEAA